MLEQFVPQRLLGIRVRLGARKFLIGKRHRRMLGRPLEYALDLGRDPFDALNQDVRILRRLRGKSVAPQPFCHAFDRLLQEGVASAQLGEIPRLPVAAFVGHFQVREEFTLEHRQSFDHRDMTFERAELRFREAPGRLLQLTQLGVLDVGQADQPTLGRNQHAGGFQTGRQIQDQAAIHAFGVPIGVAPPNLRQTAHLQGQVDQAILEILDARQVGQPASISNGDSHGDESLSGC